MRQEARITLEVIRAANNQNVWLTPTFMELLGKALPITDEERKEVFEVLAADLREQHAGKPSFERVKQGIEDIKKDEYPI
jgi:hypothetical protein